MLDGHKPTKKHIMKKLIPFIITGTLIICSFDVGAYEKFKLQQLPAKKQPFIIKSLAQDASDEGVKGKIMATAGVGFNIFGKLLEGRYYLSTYYDFGDNISSSQGSPMYNIGVDYGFAKKFSVGVAFGYQTAVINLKDVVRMGDHYEDRWTRIHMAFRGDYYIVAKENLNLYTGLKFGYNMYTVKTTVPAQYYPGYLSNLDVTPQPLSIQAHFGFSYYFMDMIGFNAEVGVGFGGPYLFAAGVAVKI